MQRLTHKEDISAVSHLLENTGKHLLNRKKEYCLRSLICPTKKHNIFCLLLGSGFGCCKIQLVAILYTVASTRVMSPIDTHHYCTEYSGSIGGTIKTICIGGNTYISTGINADGNTIGNNVGSNTRSQSNVMSLDRSPNTPQQSPFKEKTCGRLNPYRFMVKVTRQVN